MAACAVIITFLAPGASTAAPPVERHGLISVEDYFSTGSAAAYDRNILTTRMRFDLTKINRDNGLSFHFDGRERMSLGPGDYNSNIKSVFIDTFNLQYSGQRYYLSAGRLRPKDLPIESVDGVNVLYQTSDLGMGFFTGSRPDPYTGAVNPDFLTAGAYLSYRKDDIASSVAFVHTAYKGGTDRQYLYGTLSYVPVTKTRFYGSVMADVDRTAGGLSPTNAIVELTYLPDGRMSLAVGYTQFRAIRYWRSMDYDINGTRQDAYYISGNWRLGDRYAVYGRIERQTRDYQTAAAGGSPALSNVLNMGLSADNLLDTGMNMNLSASLTDNYSSRNDSYRMELNRLFRDVLQIVLSGSVMASSYEITGETDNAYSLGAAGYLFISRNWSASASFDREQASGYSTNRLMTRLSYKF
ncbi:MAG: hypothetical protein HY890_01000 [Deltaproteobacteria bacterium]|nr:hypothetical protein [Deltaproteobacteria bacterium]